MKEVKVVVDYQAIASGKRPAGLEEELTELVNQGWHIVACVGGNHRVVVILQKDS
jgi:hypothetical protein